MEPDAYDHYLVFDSDWHVQIWLNSTPHPTLLEDREVSILLTFIGRSGCLDSNIHSRSLQRWTESCVWWSPLGTYLATVHKLGVILWGGPNFSRIQRFVQQHVQFIDFSPCEQWAFVKWILCSLFSRDNRLFFSISDIWLRSLRNRMPQIKRNLSYLIFVLVWRNVRSWLTALQCGPYSVGPKMINISRKSVPTFSAFTKLR